MEKEEVFVIYVDEFGKLSHKDTFKVDSHLLYGYLDCFIKSLRYGLIRGFKGDENYGRNGNTNRR